MQTKGQKKLTVTSKATTIKKPSLQIKIPHQNDHGKNAANTFSTFKEDKGAGKCPTISTVTSPSNFKNIQPILEEPESVKESPKRKVEPMAIQKRGSGKETPFPKVQIQPRMAATQLGSPKSAFNKEKVLISYGSQKNLNNIKPLDRKETPGITHNKVEELQRLLNDQKMRTSTLMDREEQLSKENDTLNKQNNSLKEQIVELKKKIERFKVSNEEIKKLLKERINSFNQEGGELQTLREQVQTLSARVNSLLTENQALKMQLNKYDCENLSFAKDTRNQYTTSIVKEVVPLSGSRISGQYLKESQDGDDFKVFEGMDGFDEDLDLQSYITEKQESYLQEYKANMNVFEKIKVQYEGILSNIELRYKNLAQDYEATIASQAAEIYDLEMKVDELRAGDKGGVLDNRISIDVDQVIIRAQGQIARQNLALYDLKAANRDLISQVEQKSAQLKFLQTELQISSLKGRFKDENDKFEYNVAKLNLLNIIDKLKLRVDLQKDKYEKFKARVSSAN